jgi:CRP-like cAMP-binding protein
MNTKDIPAGQLLFFRKELEPYIVFDEPQWEIFKSHLTYSSFQKKDHFVVQGKVCDAIGFIAKGSIRYYTLKDGTDITGYFSFSGEMVSSYLSFLKREPALNYIQALESTDLILISRTNLQSLLDHPILSCKIERFGRLMAEHYCCCYEERIASFINQTAEERYLKLMETGRDILQRIPQHYIANYLGITPVSLSRIRKRIFVHSD